jgi:ketosteroid isomerase-like protein
VRNYFNISAPTSATTLQQFAPERQAEGNGLISPTGEQMRVEWMGEQRGTNLDIVRAMFDAFESKDMDALEQLFHEDIVAQFPYRDDSTPISGRATVLDEVGGAITAFFKSVVFTIDEVYPVKDGEHLILEYHSRAIVNPDDATYANTYVGVFRLKGGQIALFKEYYNPQAILAVRQSRT